MGKSKQRKRGTMRRAYLKTYSAGFINAGKGPNKATLQEYQERARPYDNVLWTALGLPSEVDSEERRAVFDLIEKMKLQEPLKLQVQLLDNSDFRLVMFYRPNYSSCWFVRYNKNEQHVQSSISYGSRDRAMLAFKTNRISYVSCVLFSTLRSTQAAIPPSPRL